MSETESTIQEHSEGSPEEAHMSPAAYWKIFAVLTVLTLIEVAVYYIESWRPAFMTIFLVLSAAKFLLVVAYFMHLRFDNKLFSWMLVGGFVLATCIIFALLALFNIIGG